MSFCFIFALTPFHILAVQTIFATISTQCYNWTALTPPISFFSTNVPHPPPSEMSVLLRWPPPLESHDKKQCKSVRKDRWSVPTHRWSVPSYSETTCTDLQFTWLRLLLLRGQACLGPRWPPLSSPSSPLPNVGFQGESPNNTFTVYSAMFNYFELTALVFTLPCLFAPLTHRLKNAFSVTRI